MKDYEAILILNPRITEEKVENIVDRLKKKITDSNGEVVKVNRQGVKKLPFTFQKHKRLKDGLYMAVDFKGIGKTSESLVPFLRLQEDIVRFMITIKEESNVAVPAEIVPEESVSIEAKPAEVKEEPASGQS